MPFCINCGRELLEDFEFCPECGHKVTDATDKARVSFADYVGGMKVCKKCGEQMPEDAFYCLNCGNLFSEQTTNSTATQSYGVTNVYLGTWRNKWVALLLCVCFGWLGLHRFYEGKVFTGLLYLCTLGFLGIGWFVDIIRIASKTNPYQAK